jgi:hypothetical protein
MVPKYIHSLASPTEGNRDGGIDTILGCLSGSKFTLPTKILAKFTLY